VREEHPRTEAHLREPFSVMRTDLPQIKKKLFGGVRQENAFENQKAIMHP
jgi:hypothetical protein